MKKFSTVLILLLCLMNMGFIPEAYGQAATLPYTQDFSTTNDLTLLNGTQPNKWFHGNVTGNPGNSLYISNDNGVTNGYNVNSASVVQAYRDITIPAGSTISTFSFDWKGVGENGWDYLRVWLVPATFTPTPGTQITAGTGRTQVGQFNLQTTWQTFVSPTLNISAYAGSTMRLVFEWRNDGILGAQPAIAIDNINLFIPTCLVPMGQTTSAITATSATLSWTAPTPAPANGYQIYYNTTGVPPTSATVGTPVTGTSTTLNPLTPNTTYYWWVRAVCSPTDSSMWMSGPNFTTTQIPATIPYTQNFNTTNDLGFTSGTQPNKWYFGNVTGNPGNSIYISNDNGVTNSYNVNSASVVHAYRDISVPTGTTLAYLLFDWKGFGESTFDYLRVWMVPSSFVPVAGTQITAGGGRIQIGGNFNQQTTWQNYLNTAVNLSTFAGSTMRLVFEWRNDGIIGTQPAIAVDNINLFIPSCFVPTAMGVTTVTSTTATINWTAPTPAPANGYQVFFNTTGVPPTGATAGTPVAGTSTTLTPLTPNTTYYWWVRAMCSPTNPSIWVAGPSFTTTQIPATIPYYQPFTTGPNDFGFTSGTQTNKWFMGAATGNTGNSIYISNDAGATNSYTITSASTVHAYRDIAVPAGTTIAKLSFDWKAVGESSFDYLRVWLVPATYMPTAGTQITAGTGRVQLGTNYNQQATWLGYLNSTLNLSSFAGTTMRLVFEWRNDGSGGTQPPVAIDNVKLVICKTTTPVVTLTNITHNSVTLTWPQDSGEASYTIRYRPIGSPTWQTIAVPAQPYPTPTNTYTLTQLLSATQYEVEVAAICNTTTGGYSHNQFLTRCDPTPPNVTISNITTTTALVTWTPLAASSTYTMRYRIVGTTAWTTVNLPAPPANNYPLTGLNVYTTYEVQIANKCDGETTLNPWSSPKVFTTERTCEIPPPGLTITTITPTSAVVVWDPFPGATYILRYRKVGIPSWTTINTPTNTVTLTGLLELTKYEMQVANICSGTPGNFTPLYFFTTPTVIYCQMSAQSSAQEYISKVTVKPTGKPTMENPSGASNYTDYTGAPATFIELIQGSTGNEITIEKTSTNEEGIAVWIDFDRSGTFDPNERILANGPNTNTPVTGTFSVPANAFVSTADYKYVLMRVAMQRGGIPVNCTSFPYGEVEDYTVRISKVPVPNSLNQDDIMIYPNPVSSVLHVKNISSKAAYKIYNSAGQLISDGFILNNQINVSKLISGVYVIYIEDVEGTVQKKFIKE
ncbi:fibronectin type III domain-containing protein [Chryseobacterium daecheongense]|uniref:Secreted protein (Por secretion system target) n=1 Tax=Chryseobacterium daecheongense TaxID=192389 RepID=A0A3N0W2V0_9FLAO|nr:fibronectin type III domain-containing protein [Chryseobacterium daecheongense]ROH99395.1 T9SS C-terminal target domain-containing protein [Chryseobacterium daecheongense]TDX95708.1 putative secreted protein (Por secretion system target) [Chryseobacterium daecheongense]